MASDDGASPRAASAPPSHSDLPSATETAAETARQLSSATTTGSTSSPTTSAISDSGASIGEIGARIAAKAKAGELHDLDEEEKTVLANKLLSGGAGDDELNVVAAYKAHFREDPLFFLSNVYRYRQGVSWRGYQNYIGSPILYEGQSEEVIRAVVSSDQVKSRVAALAQSRVDHLFGSIPPPKTAEERQRLQKFKDRKKHDIEVDLLTVARRMVENSTARLDSLSFLKGFAYSVELMLARMYHQGIHISGPQVVELRRVAAFAAKRKQTILYLPCHKSHIDYLTLSWLLFRLGLAVPHIVAGENLDLPGLGVVLRGGGAFFIRRTFSGDQLYPEVIREYIEQLMRRGHSMECFIEGTRSRTGKVLPAKVGILKYVVEGLQRGVTDDVWICPVSVQYDSVIESGQYAEELLGKPKEAESLQGLLSGTSVLGLKLGRIDVRFNTPWSLKGFLEEQRSRREAPGPKGEKVELDIDNNSFHKILLLKALGYRILADINNMSVIMPAAMVGTVLLTLRGRGVGRTELIRKVDKLRDDIMRKGFKVANFGKLTTGEIVDRAIKGPMAGLIEVQTDVMEPTYTPAKRFELSFYRNQVIHVFVSEALLCAALYTKVKQGGPTPMQFMTRKELVDECGFISVILKNEFVYGTDPLEANVDATIAALEKDAIFEVREDDTVGLTQRERDIGRDGFDSYLFLCWPFIEGYWLAATSLLLLAPPPPSGETPGSNVPWFGAKAFEKSAQLLGKTLYQQGELSYLEAINAATLSQAMNRYEEMGIVQRRKSEGVKPVPLIALNPSYLPGYDEEGNVRPTGKLYEFVERLSTFRREGKDRRDVGDVVGGRILGLVKKGYSTPVEVTRRKREEAEEARI